MEPIEQEKGTRGGVVADSELQQSRGVRLESDWWRALGRQQQREQLHVVVGKSDRQRN